MIVDTTAGRITNAARAHAVATARTGTTVQTLGIEMATTSSTPNSATRNPTKAIAAGGLRRNRASARRPAMAIAIRVGMAMSVPIDAPLEGVEPEVLVEVEAQEQRGAEQGEPEGGHADQEVVEAPDLAQPLEGHRQRDGQLVLDRRAAPRRAPTASRSGPAGVP